GALAMVALILILAVGVSSQLAIRARRAEVLATRRLAESRASQAKAAKAEEEATKRAAAEATARKNSDAVSIFLMNVFSGFTPGRDPKSVTVAERLSDAVHELHNPGYELAQQKELLYRVGGAYISLNLPQEAVPLLEEYRDYCLTTFGPEDPRTFKPIRLLSLAYDQCGRLQDATKLMEESLERGRRSIGLEDPGVQAGMDANSPQKIFCSGGPFSATLPHVLFERPAG